MGSQEEAKFLDWIKAGGGSVSEKIIFHQFEGMGRGMIANQPIQADEVLFSIPRPLLLTTSTSRLSSFLPASAWSSLGGWTPLILVLLYENIQAPSHPWLPYFSVLPPPTSFQSLMFWSSSELAELQASSVVSKIGKEDAETEWRDVVKPFVEQHKTVFGNPDEYTLERFHWAGSLILSRSFHVDSGVTGESDDEDSDDDEEEESEKVEDVAMVPLADHLNARSGCENAKLFYEPLTLNMVSTASIATGSQIWNTYADPPNADLLRRYGHVDPDNAFDLVEIGLDFVAEKVGKQLMGLDEKDAETRAEWLLDLGVDDTFSLTESTPLPQELLSSIQLFLFPFSSPALEKALQKESPPKAKVTPETSPQYIDALKSVLQARLGEYATSLEEDEALLASESSHSLSQRNKMAVLVRLGEKRILKTALAAIDQAVKEKTKKRKGGSSEGEKQKKSKA